ncbi:MAG: sigma-70 family RNA polymerase sigma factor [Lachnospiraceae bacterium]|nr:sigma-70 family RNA polymerase sigma factor [Lachnospiraceae bacterium]MBQ3905513.1 sigma-70 family RNA polymerase sigma factor [Lachnospiraceae bacterium]
MLILLSTIDNEIDRENMERIIKLYADEMHLQAVMILHDNEDAQDAVQNAMVNICKHIKHLQKPTSPRTRCYAIEAAKNAAIDIYRRKKRKWEKEIPFDEAFPDEDLMPRYDGENETLRQIFELPKRDKDILMLKYVYGFEYGQIARMLDISKEAAKKMGQRARDKLEKSMKMEDPSSD